jgi:hypothetical protein
MRPSDLEVSSAELDVLRCFLKGVTLETGECCPWLIDADALSRALSAAREKAKMMLDTSVSNV